MSTDFMLEAIKIAQQTQNEVPVGAVIVMNGEIIASAHNQKESSNDPTAHAEIIAIRQACQRLNSWRLNNCNIYVTLEPCPMCAWAILQSRIDNVYFGSYDNIYGAMGSKLDLTRLTSTKTKVYAGIHQKECDNIINEFFERLR